MALRAGQTPRDGAVPTVGGGGVIGGVVTIDGRPTRPAPESIVTLTGGAFPSGQIVVTDEHGRFAFQGLAPGHYTLSTAKASYVPVFFGSKRLGRGPGTPIVIDEGQHVDDLKLILIPGAVITGVTSDHLGRQQPNATILILDAAVAPPGRHGTSRRHDPLRRLGTISGSRVAGRDVSGRRTAGVELQWRPRTDV